MIVNNTTFSLSLFAKKLKIKNTHIFFLERKVYT